MQTAWLLAVAVVVLVALAWRRRAGREGFRVSRHARAVAGAADLFARAGTSFREFRARVPAGSAVDFSDARALARAGRLTPEEMQRRMDR